MFKFLTAAALSATVALTSLSPAPAQAASRDNLGPILFGASILAIIAAAANAEARDDRKVKRHKPAPVARAQPTLPRATIVRPHNSNKARVVEPIPPRRVLPAKCSRSFQFENGQRDFLLKNCLKNNGVRVGKLPDRCERLIDVDGHRQLRTGWKAGCLRREGYVLR